MKKWYKGFGIFLVFFSMAFLLLLLVTACMRQPNTDHNRPPTMHDSTGEKTGTEEQIEEEEKSPPLVIKSENPVLTDSHKVLEELEKEVAELLKILDGMDTIEDRELDF